MYVFGLLFYVSPLNLQGLAEGRAERSEERQLNRLLGFVLLWSSPATEPAKYLVEVLAGSVVLLDRVSVSLAIVRHSAHIEPQMRTPQAARLVTIYELWGHQSKENTFFSITSNLMKSPSSFSWSPRLLNSRHNSASEKTSMLCTSTLVSVITSTTAST